MSKAEALVSHGLRAGASRSAQRCLRLLGCLSEVGHALPLAELSSVPKLPKATVHRVGS